MLGEGVDVVIRPPAETLETMSQVVRDMHDDVRACSMSSTPASRWRRRRQQVLAYIRQHVPGRAQGPPRRQHGLRRPRLPRPRHARRSRATCTTACVDVSGIKELVRRWYPRVYFASPDKSGGHRALADIRE